MRGRSSKLETKEGMEVDKLSKLKEEPQLSGAYIRNLVKQLTSSRTKDPMNPKDQGGSDNDVSTGKNMNKSSEAGSENQQSPPPQQHKKQVRRRLHTSRPYQERLLNMAEARREIVTALKFHRAAMKQANEQQQQQLQGQQEQQQQQQQQQQQISLPEQLSAPPCFEQEGKIKSRRNPRIYPSNTANFSNYLDTLSYNSFSNPPPPPSYPYSWPSSTFTQTIPENFNFPLPNQTLGLNLNIHDFNNIDTTLYHSSSDPLSGYSPSSPSSSSFPSLPITPEEFPSIGNSQDVLPPDLSDVHDCYGGGGLHQVINDEEMAEIRSLGEQHQMEWNDTMNLVTSAWWFKFMKTMELGPQVKAEQDEYQPFDPVMEFPAWMNENDGCLQQHFNDYCSQDYFRDPALPCMDIGEIDGMDGEWLS
ncbi:hypothetical protein Tsubulata_031314 [Turnera subulata]|uniref:Uncharacterized protein n=1 Tax=Turnera subulata TaxID=218843 RepID=A0A9Q0GI90_9ROSI|nr:hypothetical protein Tsubulata_031314 [Turnera subulata]